MSPDTGDKWTPEDGAGYITTEEGGRREVVVLSPEEAAEIADHLADYDITARLSSKEDDRPTEAVEWSRELRRRIRDVQDEDES